MPLPFVEWDVYLSDPRPQWLGTVHAQPAPVGQDIDATARNVASFEFMTLIKGEDFSVNPRAHTLEDLEEMRKAV